MSNIQQLTSMISALNEKFNQLEQNSKRIFELPENESLNGSSKFAISRPLDLGEITEYTTLNAILGWCIEEMQNIENATRVVQMLPPELLSGPRRIKIPVVDGDDVDVPIVWKILGVDYVEETEVIINIPDASEDNYRKDLILGTQDGDVIRMAGFESEEGIIEPIQPENTVLLTAITLFGDTVLDEPTEPIVGDIYVKKASQGWVGYQININSTQVAPTLAANHSIAFRAFANGHSIIGLNITSYVPDKIWSGATFGIRNDSDFPITLKHLYVSSSKIRFNFPSGQDLILTKEMGVKYFKLGTVSATGFTHAYCLNDFVSGGVTSDDVSNESNVTGATVTDALNNLDIQFDNFIPLSGTEVGKPITGALEFDGYIGNSIIFNNPNEAENYASIFNEDGSTRLLSNDVNLYLKYFDFSGGASDFLIDSENPDFKGIIGDKEFDKQGDRKAFAQIADVEDAVSTKLDKAPDGTNNLIDVDNKLNPVYLPPNIMHLQGEWNADTNTPTLSNGTGIAGYIYEVTTAGTTDFGDGDIEFALGDWVVYGGDDKWYKSPNTGEVVGVKGDNESNYRKGLVNIDIDDVIAPTANQFLVGNSAGTEWEKRGIRRSDLVPMNSGHNLIGYWSSSENLTSVGYSASAVPLANALSRYTPVPDGGRLKANNAIDSNDLVPLGQLEGMLVADNIDYDNTASGLLAETVQEAVDEVVENISKAGFEQRTGTAIAFDKWATYGTYASPVSGNLSYSFTNLVKGMIQVMYHEDTVAPTLTDTGVTVIETGDYVVENINKITIHCIDENVVEVNIKSL